MMHGLIRTVMWRHRKVHVEHEIVLPRCRVEEVMLDLSPLERSYYDKRHDEVKRMIRNLKGGSVSAGVFVALTTLRQICCHPQIVRRDDGLLGPSGQRLTMEQIVGKSVHDCPFLL
jgi:E3 ubiquitin-protein ligase SHPRH